MSLTAGAKLGPYLIEAPIGAGGMGEVYRAVDTRLHRAVAIKVLAPRLTEDAHARERFEREARAVAALEHPHICPLYDVGEHEGASFLVMQYLKGETLAERLRHGPLPLDQALRYAVELARALHAAHRAGLVHRDLKPGNVMLTKSGVQLLDFGVASVAPPVPPLAGSAIAESTRAASLTEKGILVGTPQYMAPEQLEGRRADARTDIFALGAVIYEMTTGRKAFQGDSHARVIAGILNADPAPISPLREDVPPALDRTVRKCLLKDPDARWQTASDLADELHWILDARADASGISHTSGPALLRDARVWLLGFALSGTAAAAVWMLKPPARAATVSPVHFTVDLPAGAQIPSDADDTILAFSPDGRHLVYTVAANGQTQLWIRPVDKADSQPIVGTEGGTMPFFSPDGRSIGFTSQALLKRISIEGGPPAIIAPTPDAVGATWSGDGRIVFAPFNRSGLSIASANGDSPRPLTTLDPEKGHTSHRFPEFLPGARAIIFTAGPPTAGPWYDAEIIAQSLDTGDRHVLIRGAAQAHYVSTGYLVYARAGTLFAVAFDPKALRVTGSPVAVLEGVKEDQSSGVSQFAVSANGSLAYVPGGLRHTEVMWVNRPRPMLSTAESTWYSIGPRSSGAAYRNSSSALPDAPPVHRSRVEKRGGRHHTVSLEHLAILHHELHLFERVNVIQRITG
jgi:serine/threonine protein kinase